MIGGLLYDDETRALKMIDEPPSHNLGHDLALPPSLSRRISGDNAATSLLLATARAKTQMRG